LLQKACNGLPSVTKQILFPAVLEWVFFRFLIVGFVRSRIFPGKFRSAFFGAHLSGTAFDTVLGEFDSRIEISSACIAAVLIG
jgi:hypothetical protein